MLKQRTTGPCPSWFNDKTQQRPLVLDGAMGTSIQGFNLSDADFDGLDGCNEVLVATRPDVIEAIHTHFLQAGADIIETNSFGSNRIVLDEYGIGHRTHELNLKAAQLAKAVAQRFSTAQQPRYVAGSVGPGTKLPTLGHVSYATLKTVFEEQITSLVEGGVDMVLLETCQDLLQIKAALAAVHAVEARLGRYIPKMVQVTVETTGTLLVGSDMNAVIAALEPYHLDALGMNCATGPQEMEEHIRTLSHSSPFAISCVPNAGIPENVGGQAHYHLTPAELKNYLQRFVGELGVQVIGGCCGTCPSHIEALAALAQNVTPARRTPSVVPQLSSLYSATPLTMPLTPPVLVGERTNANGSKLFRDLLAQEAYDDLVDIGKEQVRKGAHLLDVCTAYVGRDEVRDMQETLQRMNQQVDVPLMVDSTELNVLKASLELLGGRCIVNSINLEDGEERPRQVLALCKEFGAAVVALTIDEDGMAKTVEKKVAVATRLLRLCEEAGLRECDVVFDTLTFTLGSGDEEFRKAGMATIEAIRQIKALHPQVGFVLGISNISFGLQAQSRHVLNSLFLHYAVEAGLTMAIVNSAHLLPLHKISEQEKELCRRLVFDERPLAPPSDPLAQPTEDPLMQYMSYFQNHQSSASASATTSALPTNLEERLQYRIVDGNKTGLDEDLALALQSHSPLHIINTILLEGMKTVGELFGSGQMQLPFVLQSAETMKKAVAFLEPHMEKTTDAAGGGANHKGKCVLATVKGDVHDIGKNLVDIILTNNGYKVSNLGIKQPIEAILEAAAQEQADCIAMSGLLVKSTAIMKENLQLMQQRGLSTPVVLGGAALTQQFVEGDCQQAYAGPVVYARSAFDTLNTLDAIMAAKASGTPFQSPAQLKATAQAAAPAIATAAAPKAPAAPLPTPRSVVTQGVPVPTPPFWGVKVVEDIALEAVYPFLNEKVLMNGHWSFRRGNKTAAEQAAFIAEKVAPILQKLKAQTAEQGLLTPKVIYGYFPCQAEGDDVVIYEDPSTSKEIWRFTFPRGGKKNLCLADYIAPVGGSVVDVLPLQLVTVGQTATAHGKTLFDAGDYTDYYFFHGFAVEMAEALAEYWHHRVRAELGISAKEAGKVGTALLKPSAYQGCRYSFGYPACPNLEDQTAFFKLLEPQLIGVSLTESFLLEPEQSTSALVLHHPEAYYFDTTAPEADEDEMMAMVHDDTLW
jgi:5-methyltetrahydrofolate--homocysteine methyltransferase